MEVFEPQTTLHFSFSCSSSRSSNSCCRSSEEELGQIVELPHLGTSFESPDLSNNELVFFDTVEGWSYSHPWYRNIYDGGDNISLEDYYSESSFGALKVQ
ncbi:unnamed protein product [Lupinus luteus]|uniref:Uncharacterized protein n=1 Tax=Lupinus luteus TaxID=3873 RepID=A0AAV1WWR8_LUPLU